MKSYSPHLKRCNSNENAKKKNNNNKVAGLCITEIIRSLQGIKHNKIPTTTLLHVS